jgi:hypothetical protein
MSKVKVNGVEMESDSIAYTNMVVDEAIKDTILEAVKHFETSRPRSYEDDSRFFYKQSELDMFWSLFKGDPNNLKCNIIIDDNGGVFCYEICRIERKNRV